MKIAKMFSAFRRPLLAGLGIALLDGQVLLPPPRSR